MSDRLSFASDYMEGAHPAILQRLLDINLEKNTGYGFDRYSESAREKIRAACAAPQADVWFLVGGTQTNATVIDAMLSPWQGVVAAGTGHISVHEAGAIERGGHKVLELEGRDGKIFAGGILECIKAYQQDENHDHMVMPGLVYLSQPTEYGTLYTLDELRAISRVCRENDVKLYVDGARLAYALACEDNDVTLPDLAALCDAFYIGGTKCGALLGEAVVFPKHDTVPHFFTIIKQHGALLAKGWVAGLAFDTLFTDGLYEEIGRNAIEAAQSIRETLIRKGYDLPLRTPTNQIFVRFENAQAAALSQQVDMGFWEKSGENHTIMRLATSWATVKEDVDRLNELL